MSAELIWYYQSNEIDEPMSINDGQTYTLVLKNIGDSIAYDVGFYLKEGTVDPIAQLGTGSNIVYPSTKGTLIDLHDVLTWGSSPGQGYTIYQGVYTDTFDTNTGNSIDNPIPLRIGPTSTNQLSPNESVTLQVSLDAPVAELPQRKYINLEVVHSNV